MPAAATSKSIAATSPQRVVADLPRENRSEFRVIGPIALLELNDKPLIDEHGRLSVRVALSHFSNDRQLAAVFIPAPTAGNRSSPPTK